MILTGDIKLILGLLQSTAAHGSLYGYVTHVLSFYSFLHSPLSASFTKRLVLQCCSVIRDKPLTEAKFTPRPRTPPSMNNFMAYRVNLACTRVSERYGTLSCTEQFSIPVIVQEECRLTAFLVRVFPLC